MIKTCVVSGGARGIGRCSSRRFLERGYRVYILDIDTEELEHTVNVHLKQYKEQNAVDYAICDLRDSDQIRTKIVDAAKFLGGHITVLVNNGGVANPKWKDDKTMEHTDTLAEWQAYIDTNLTAPFAVSQACIPYMKTDNASQSSVTQDSHSDAGPCIIHIGSFRALQSDQNQEGYASSKAGLLGLTHSMAISLAPQGIRVNLVAPGRIKVQHECKQGDLKNLTWADQVREQDVLDHPVNRAGRPKDIADAVEFLVNAGFVNGQDITVDGGATKIKR